MANRPNSSTGELAGGWEPPPSSPDDPLWRSASRATPFRTVPEFSLLDDDPEPLSTPAAPPHPGASTLARAAASTRPTPAGQPSEAWPGDDVRFPRIGETLAGFRLVSVLGHGSFATVYLAEQIELGGRPVALKVARALGDEPHWLARLQHAHIVPIHSVHDDPRTGLRLLCMPYLGGANLAQLLETSAGLAPVQPTGRSLLKALDRLASRAEGSNPAAPPPPATPAEARSRIAGYLNSIAGRRPDPGYSAEAAAPHNEPARAFYRSNPFPRVAVYITACLAEALDHAHKRGILHHDLKPSNVLIAADGTPMLLDFNLSETTTPDDDHPARVGGTLPYMAPEHLRAFHPATRPGEVVVDARSDLYSLGLILYELLTGRPPYAEPDPNLPITKALDRMIAERQGPPPSPRAANPDISPGLDSIVRTCLALDPIDRYPDAATLAEDLHRYLDDRPLVFASEPSLRERLAKWLRRHPEARSSSTIGTVALVLLLALAAASWNAADRLATASARVQFEEFQRLFRACQLNLNTTHGPVDRLGESLAIADRALAVYGIDSPGFPDRTLNQINRLPEPDRRLLREQLAELLILHARAGVAHARLAGPGPMAAALRAGIADLDRAEAIDPEPPATLYRERQAMADLLDRPDDAARDTARAEALPPRTARDFYLEGTVLAAGGHLDEAEARLIRAVTLDPSRFWAWFALGLCRFDQARYVEAEADFRACTLLAPDFAWPHLNRGLALARAGRLDEARAACDRAIELDPSLVEARINRALIALELGDVAAAEADLAAAAVARPRDAAILAAHAEALARLGRRDEAETRFEAAIAAAPSDPAPLVARGFTRIGHDDAGARRDLEAALRLDPASARAHLGLAHLDRHGQIERALTHLDAALTLDPDLLDAIQLRALLHARRGDPAAEADVDRLLETPTPLGLYNAACALAVLGERTANAALLRRARVTLDRAIARGIDEVAARADPDLAPLFRD